MLSLKPDMASLATGSVNFPTRVYENSPELVDWLAAEMLKHGVKPEIEAFDLSMIFQAAAMQKAGKIKAPLHVQFVMGVKNAMPVDREVFEFYVKTLKRLAPDATWTGAGIGKDQATAQPLVGRARRALPHRARGQRAPGPRDARALQCRAGAADPRDLRASRPAAGERRRKRATCSGYDHPRAHARAVQSARDGRHRVHRVRDDPAAGVRRLCCSRWGSPPVARHRSREVMLYRQGTMNLIVNSHARERRARPRCRPSRCACATPRFAHKHSLDLGAWDMPTRASAMELNIPGHPRRRRQPDLLRRPLPRLLDLRRRLRPLAGTDPQPAGGRRAALVRRRAGDPRRPHPGLGRLLPQSVRLLGAAARPVLRRAAEGHAAREPVPQVLPAAHRAAAGRRGHPLGRGPGARRAWARRTSRRRCARCRSAASCSSTAARCSRATRAR